MHPNDGTISTGVAVGIGASSIVVGFYGTFKEILNAVYPYPRGALPDRLGNQATLINLGLVTAPGYSLWALAPLSVGFHSLAYPSPVRSGYSLAQFLFWHGKNWDSVQPLPW